MGKNSINRNVRPLTLVAYCLLVLALAVGIGYLIEAYDRQAARLTVYPMLAGGFIGASAFAALYRARIALIILGCALGLIGASIGSSVLRGKGMDWRFLKAGTQITPEKHSRNLA